MYEDIVRYRVRAVDFYTGNSICHSLDSPLELLSEGYHVPHPLSNAEPYNHPYDRVAVIRR